MGNPSRIGRASEITADGALQKVPGNSTLALALDQLTGVQVVHSAALPVNQAATSHFVVPFDAEIIGGNARIITQQTSANGSFVIERNGSSIGSLTVATADPAGTVMQITVGTSGTISSANAILSAGDVITFSRPNTGASGVVAGSLVLIPRA
jgi:hypothetical protein